MAPIWSVMADRKDAANQGFWTQSRLTAVDGCCPAQPGSLVLLGPDCKINPCFLPSMSGLTIEINGVVSPCQNVLNFIPGTGISITYEPDCGYLFTATGSPTDCGSAAYLCTDEVGVTVEVDISHPTHAGQMLISQPGNTTAIWADPQVQGLYAAGSTICPAPAYVAPTCIQPILIGGADCNGVLQNVSVTTGGEVIVLAQDQETDINVQRFSATTGLILASNITGNLIPVLSISPKTSAGAVRFVFRNLDFMTGGVLTHWQLLLNPTLTGASFANVDPASDMTFDTSATSYTGGRLLDSGFIGNAGAVRSDYEFTFNFSGAVPPVVTLVFAPTNVGTAPAKRSVAGCSFAWDEQATCL
jgi:hypothetical protein